MRRIPHERKGDPRPAVDESRCPRNGHSVCSVAGTDPRAACAGPASWLYYWKYVEAPAVSETSQKRALKSYRRRLRQRGMARFEVLGLDADRELIRSLARRLAENDPDARRIRATVSRTIAGEPPRKGGILAALCRSPLVGADLDIARPVTQGRKVAL